MATDFACYHYGMKTNASLSAKDNMPAEDPGTNAVNGLFGEMFKKTRWQPLFMSRRRMMRQAVNNPFHAIKRFAEFIKTGLTE